MSDFEPHKSKANNQPLSEYTETLKWMATGTGRKAVTLFTNAVQFFYMFFLAAVLLSLPEERPKFTIFDHILIYLIVFQAATWLIFRLHKKRTTGADILKDRFLAADKYPLFLYPDKIERQIVWLGIFLMAILLIKSTISGA